MRITSPIETNEAIKHLRGFKKLCKGENKKINEIINLLQWYKDHWDWHNFCENVSNGEIQIIK